MIGRALASYVDECTHYTLGRPYGLCAAGRFCPAGNPDSVGPLRRDGRRHVAGGRRGEATGPLVILNFAADHGGVAARQAGLRAYWWMAAKFPGGAKHMPAWHSLIAPSRGPWRGTSARRFCWCSSPRRAELVHRLYRDAAHHRQHAGWNLRLAGKNDGANQPLCSAIARPAGTRRSTEYRVLACENHMAGEPASPRVRAGVKLECPVFGTYSKPRPSGSSRRTVVQSMPSAE